MAPSRAGAPAVALEHVDGAGERVGRDALGAVDVLSEADDDHVAGELGQRAVGPAPHQQADRVGAQVDRGQPLGGAFVVHRAGLGQALGDPEADRVGAAGQVVGVVRVQALHAARGAADPAVALGPREQAAAFARVGLVRALEHRAEVGVGLGVGVQPPDPAVGLQGRDGLDVVRAGQPVEGREGVPVRVAREVPDDQRMARGRSEAER